MNDGPLRDLAYLLAEALVEIAKHKEQVKQLQDTIIDLREQVDELEREKEW